VCELAALALFGWALWRTMTAQKGLGWAEWESVVRAEADADRADQVAGAALRRVRDLEERVQRLEGLSG